MIEITGGYNFFTTSEGNFVLIAKRVQDSIETLLSGYTYGDNVAASALFYVGEERLDTYEKFAEWANVEYERYKRGEDVDGTSTRRMYGHTDTANVPMDHYLIIEQVLADPLPHIIAEPFEDQVKNVMKDVGNDFESFLESAKKIVRRSSSECGCGKCEEFVNDFNEEFDNFQLPAE